MTKAVFFDRDGVLNEEVGFLHRMEDVRFVPGAVEAVAEIADRDDWMVFIITNQSGIGRGYYSEDEYLEFEREYLGELSRLSGGRAKVDKVYYCPHHPTKGIGKYRVDCECRKPKPGMLLAAADDFGVDLERSYIIGDKRSDIAAGAAAGCAGILVGTGYGGQGGTGCDIVPDATAADVCEAVSLILSRKVVLLGLSEKVGNVPILRRR